MNRDEASQLMKEIYQLQIQGDQIKAKVDEKKRKLSEYFERNPSLHGTKIKVGNHYFKYYEKKTLECFTQKLVYNGLKNYLKSDSQAKEALKTILDSRRPKIQTGLDFKKS